MNLTLIADYGKSDLAELEVKTKLKRLTDIHSYNYLSVNPFNTIEAGFVLAQLVMNNNGTGVYYVNVAPRKEDLKERENNAGEKLVAGVVNNNLIVAVNSGFTLSYVKEFYDSAFYTVNCGDLGSQFRSRDIFPSALVGLEKDLRERWLRGEHGDYPYENSDFFLDKVTNIPDMPENKILYIDGYGNIKINNVLTEEQKNAEKLHIRIQGEALSVYNKNGIFAVPDGEMVLAPGSSGWNYNKFLEISLRGGNAAKRFGDILPGTKVNIDLI